MSLGQAIIGLCATGLVFWADAVSQKAGTPRLLAWSRGERFRLAVRNALLGPIALAQFAYGVWVGFTVSQHGGTLHDAIDVLDTRPEGCLPEGRGCRDTSCDRCWETRPFSEEDEPEDDDEP